jgi:hypothetical protein
VSHDADADADSVTATREELLELVARLRDEVARLQDELRRARRDHHEVPPHYL